MRYKDLNDKQKEDYELIVKSKEFDSTYYCSKYDLGKNINPIVHYLKIGVFKGFNPSPLFNTNFYLDCYDDVKESTINPFVHYLRYGKNEHRIPKFLTQDEIEKLNLSEENVNDYLIILYSSEFDEKYYKRKYTLDGFLDPIAHFVEVGVHKGNNPSQNFDTQFYQKFYLGEENHNINPFVHYLKYGTFMIATPKIFKISEIDNLNLNMTIKGKSDFLFLINDSNNEIRQHFDFSYRNKFDKIKFLENYHFKKELFNDNGIEYYFFDIPDKSVVCKDFLPFNIKTMKRNVDRVKEIVDFKNLLNINHYYKFDSHLNFEGSNILSFSFLRYMDNKLRIGKWNNLLNENGVIFNKPVPIDLLSLRNWSYSEMGRRILKNKVKNNFDSIIKPSKLSSKEIPNQYRTYGNRDSVYFENPDSLSDKKALIFRDSSFDTLKWYFSFYFKEIFLCWDHGFINEDIIDYFEPDVIFEIRIERFIDNIPTPSWVKNKRNIFNL